MSEKSNRSGKNKRGSVLPQKKDGKIIIEKRIDINHALKTDRPDTKGPKKP